MNPVIYQQFILIPSSTFISLIFCLFKVRNLNNIYENEDLFIAMPDFGRDKYDGTSHRCAF